MYVQSYQHQHPLLALLLRINHLRLIVYLCEDVALEILPLTLK